MKRRFVIVIFLVILMTRALPDDHAGAQGNRTILRPDPLSLGLRPDARGTLTILIENVQDLYALEFHLTFDPDVVEVVDADQAEKGVQIEPAGWWKDGFIAVNQADNQTGRVDFAATLLGPTPPASGNRAVAGITFAARKTGVSALSIESAILSTRDAGEIPYTRQAGGVGVNLSGQAPDLDAMAGPAEATSGTANTGQFVLAGAALFAFITAASVFVYVLRRRR